MALSAILSLTFALGQFSCYSRAAPQRSVVSFSLPGVVEAGGLSNVHVTFHSPHNGAMTISYGACDIVTEEDAHHRLGSTYVGEHELAKRHLHWADLRPERFVWIVPEDIQNEGCLHAFSGDRLLGRSGPVSIGKRRSRRWLAASEIMDAMGPWFDGVEHVKEKEPGEAFVAQTKNQTIGILGGGMSGLMTAHILDSVGFHNWEIIEASGRIGGRVHTAYLNATEPDEYQYQEMGPMRFPVSVDLGNETLQIQDHRLVFQLADEINKYNNYDPSYMVNFIQWIQSSANTPSSTSNRRPDGTVPGKTEVSDNPAYQVNETEAYANATAVASAEEMVENFVGFNDDKMALYASNVFKAHKQAVAEGLLDFSESGYLRYVQHIDSNTTDQVDSVGDNGPIWPYDSLYFSATSWRTIDQGLTKLPAAFGPQVINRTRFFTEVQEMKWNKTTKKMSVGFRPESPLEVGAKYVEYDYAVVTVPFTKVRLWRLPNFSSLLNRAITSMTYEASCKVALQYKTRFWEHLDHPILGGCGSTNIPGISSICYPSYKINSTLPGVMLASYVSGDMADSVGALTEEDHVALVQRAMIEVHGAVAQEQYTGIYDRKCWREDQYEAGAWAAPSAGQQDLYLPAYFQTEKHTVFVGEHTSYTHAWIFSALESAVRGTTQLMLDMGLVDEAKAITNKWMARWIEV